MRILVVEDSFITRRVMLKMLAPLGQCDVAVNGREAVMAFRMGLDEGVGYDLICLDIQMPEMNGIELTMEIRQYYPQIRVIGLTMFKEDHLLVDMLEAGAKGYLLKTCTKEQLAEAILAVNAGGFYFCEHTSFQLSKMIGASRIEGFAPPQPGLFSEAEVQIIQLICREFSSKQIGEELHLSLRTIEAYRHKIFDKTGAKNMAGVVIYAIKTGLYKV